MARWQRVARRIRVPLGFLAAALYLFELWQRAPRPAAVAWSLALVLPGLWLRGYAAGYVKKNRELTVTGPYAYTRNPLYLGSMLIAAGFALALLSWPVALALAGGFLVIYVPVIAAEERFLRANFPGYDEYCRRVPRLIPRLRPARHPSGEDLPPGTAERRPEEAAEERRMASESPEIHPTGAEAHAGSAALTARLKSCPDTNQNLPAACKAGPAAGAGKFSIALYFRHREYNAVLGAALLYVCLLFLRAALGALLNGMR